MPLQPDESPTNSDWSSRSQRRHRDPRRTASSATPGSKQSMAVADDLSNAMSSMGLSRRCIIALRTVADDSTDRSCWHGYSAIVLLGVLMKVVRSKRPVLWQQPPWLLVSHSEAQVYTRANKNTVSTVVVSSIVGRKAHRCIPSLSIGSFAAVPLVFRRTEVVSTPAKGSAHPRRKLLMARSQPFTRGSSAKGL